MTYSFHVPDEKNAIEFLRRKRGDLENLIQLYRTNTFQDQ